MTLFNDPYNTQNHNTGNHLLPLMYESKDSFFKAWQVQVSRNRRISRTFSIIELDNDLDSEDEYVLSDSIAISPFDGMRRDSGCVTDDFRHPNPNNANHFSALWGLDFNCFKDLNSGIYFESLDSASEHIVKNSMCRGHLIVVKETIRCKKTGVVRGRKYRYEKSGNRSSESKDVQHRSSKGHKRCNRPGPWSCSVNVGW